MKSKSPWRRFTSWLSDRRVAGPPLCRLLGKLTWRSQGLSPEHAKVIREWAAATIHVRQVW